MKYRAKSIGTAALLLCLSLASDALTLGNVRGPVVIGRPLDVAIPVQLEQADNAAASCFEAEVFHADVRQSANRVRVSVEPTGAAQSILVRIQSSPLINEPVVSITLRARCDAQIERRYVLLADVPATVDLTAPIKIGSVVPEAAPSSVSSSARLSPSTASLLASAETTPAPQAKPKVSARAKAPATVKRAPKTASKTDEQAPKRVPASSGQSRLQLDNLELFSDRIALLDQAQPDAAVDYVSPDQQKVQDLQGTIQSLQAAAAKNEESLQALTARLKQSETERFPAWLVVVLAGLVLAAIAAIVVLWGRQRRAQSQAADWWSESIVSPESTAAPLTGAGKSVPFALASTLKANAEPSPVSASVFRPSSQWPVSKNHGVDVNEVEMGESRFHQYLQSGEVHAGPVVKPEAVQPQVAMPKPPSPDTVLIAELRQQADFFVALGQTDQALVVLEKLIHDSEEPNPNVFLDLLGLLHSLSKKAEFQRYRDDFNRLFNGVAHEFVRFRSEGRSLEDYPVVLADVMAHWRTPDVLNCINAHVVRSALQSPGDVLDLAAFRDLLLLQAIAQQFRAEGTELEPSARADQGSGLPELTPLPLGQDEPDLVSMMELDLDLSDEGVKAYEQREGVSSGPETPTATPVPHGNLIDFDLSEDVKTLNFNRKL